MKRLGVLLGLFVLTGVVFGATVSIDYGDSVYKTYELNDNEMLTVIINNVPEHVHGVFVTLDPSLDGHVFCAPGKLSHDANDVWDVTFSCILLKGTYEGILYFKPADIDMDENGDYLSQPRTTRLSLTVSEKEVWYTNYAYTSLGGTITVGQYTVKVNDSDVVSADVEVSKGSATIFAGVVFLGQEVKVADDFLLTFNGYSKKRGMVFFTVKTKFPVAVSSTSAEYYLVVSPVLYTDETNKARIDIYTTCPGITVCDQNNECKDYDVPDTHKVSFIALVGSYEISCKGSDLKATTDVLAPLVITKTVTKTVEKKEDPDEICPSWFFNLPDYRRTSLCGGVTKTGTGGGAASSSIDWRIIALLVLVGAGIWYYRKKGGKKGFEEPEKEIEAVPDVEG